MNMDITVYQYLNTDIIEANRAVAPEKAQSESAEPTNKIEKSSSPSFAETYDLAKRAIQAVDIDSALASLKQAGETGINLNSKLAYDLGVVTAYSYLENKASNPNYTQASKPVELHGSSCLTKEINCTSYFPSHVGSNGSDNKGVLQCSDEMQQYFEQAAAYTGLDIKLIKALAFRETSFTNITSSSSGALGVMALMPEACIDYGVTDVNNMEQNIMAGASILADNLNYYNGDLELALAAYNAGRGNIANNGNTVPSYCRKYVNDIINFYNS